MWSFMNENRYEGNDEPAVRLLKKIALIHLCGRVTHWVVAPNRSAHASMRHGKWSLNEAHEDVIVDRNQGRSIWAGTSGSAMDIIAIAQYVGVTDAQELVELSWCIFAFFHILPTMGAPTHTLHEVMTGINKNVPQLNYDPQEGTTAPDGILSHL
jgi:hypothetical protein